jgi:uncharacterized membrane protein YhiD involved in acid resistance
MFVMMITRCLAAIVQIQGSGVPYGGEGDLAQVCARMMNLVSEERTRWVGARTYMWLCVGSVCGSTLP